MKWLKLLLCVMALASVMTVPLGCDKKGITELKPQETIPAGHDAGVVERSKWAPESSKEGAKAKP